MCDSSYTDSVKLYAARRHEALFSNNIPASDRPVVHLSSHIGWMNDPNGFSIYKGRYHLFYQYHPFDSVWGPMHWGHAVSNDLIHWEHLPAAIAPDERYDSDGCFSGSAIELDDGRQLLFYTGLTKTGLKPDGTPEFHQVQCIAYGDGVNYKKYEDNPVIDSDQLPEGASPQDFRDPKIWMGEDGDFRCVLGSLDAERSGQILQYRSSDGISWEYEGVLASNHGRFGVMWECPDTFALDGKQVLLVSPQDMLPVGNDFMSGNGTLALIGHLDDETGALVEESTQPIDYGIDFYATQTLETADGRRVMVAWMQNWDTTFVGGGRPWFGQMTLPRELSVRDGRLYQWPVREIEEARRNRVAYEGVLVQGLCELDGVRGRCVDLSLTVRPQDARDPYREFYIRFAQRGRYHSSISFRTGDHFLKIKRKHSGLRRAVVKDRKCRLLSYDGILRLRIIIDRYSVEVFVGEGEQAMTMTIPTDPSFDEINFYAAGKAIMDVEKYDLV
ncbi:MAG: glycoside hydrolase family 32 protein [Coriobacteriales bacterium]|nr:glycoside hydrolase family 32 protein [Coriobacteriales bacterium]